VPYGDLSAALRLVGAEVSSVHTTRVVALLSNSDSPPTRLNVAKIVLVSLGELALSDDIEVTLNGTSLSPEIIDAACAPRVMRAV
jgi:hypothetical protein